MRSSSAKSGRLREVQSSTKIWDLSSKRPSPSSNEDKKTKAFANIDSDARNDIVVKFTNDEFKLSNLKLAGEDDAEGDAVFPPAKKAKKTAAEET